ncbi:hypothetical protein FBR02_14440 [Anaerolineae bacterium CFX9]|jgi:hypothetical protein|nr:hypothetical protein [Anaerolineae bacterium CFX9]
MRELSDRTLDEVITRALKTETMVSYAQRQRAWALLQQKLPSSASSAAEPLPVLEIVYPVRVICRLAQALFASLIADETIYQRARSAPRPSHRRYSAYYREFSPAG